jgi:hypothetical protein
VFGSIIEEGQRKDCCPSNLHHLTRTTVVVNSAIVKWLNEPIVSITVGESDIVWPLIVEECKLCRRNGLRIIDDNPCYSLCTRWCCQASIIVDKFSVIQRSQESSELNFGSKPFSLICWVVVLIVKYLINEPTRLVATCRDVKKDCYHRKSSRIWLIVNNVQLKVVEVSIESMFTWSMEVELKR